ncbi:MAG TPA: hypothetical protein VNK46_12390 [Nitrospiraceae bacterium]|nr:hypothetical protein [Nitrospiraceae bacterium]
MNEHIFLPTLDIRRVVLLPEHKAWLESWLREIEPDIERGDVAASMCLQGVISEILLHQRVVTDWIGVMEEYLTRDGKPLAYSEQYGKRLYEFAFWIQCEVHAIHARWWIEQACGASSSLDFRALIEDLIQPSGWMYNPQVSPTGMRTRMKSEYLMSLAMGMEILKAYGGLEERRTHLEGLLSAEPLTGYLSAEHFRLFALRLLGSPKLAPATLPRVLAACEAGEGYCDFDVSAKIDDYMGVAKRTARDIPVHSALSALHAASLASSGNEDVQARVAGRVRHFSDHIKSEPMDIQPFRMREIDVPFGTGLSPLEVIAASGITCGDPFSVPL